MEGWDYLKTIWYRQPIERVGWKLSPKTKIMKKMSAPRKDTGITDRPSHVLTDKVIVRKSSFLISFDKIKRNLLIILLIIMERPLLSSIPYCFKIKHQFQFHTFSNSTVFLHWKWPQLTSWLDYPPLKVTSTYLMTGLYSFKMVTSLKVTILTWRLDYPRLCE